MAPYRAPERRKQLNLELCLHNLDGFCWLAFFYKQPVIGALPVNPHIHPFRKQLQSDKGWFG